MLTAVPFAFEALTSFAPHSPRSFVWRPSLRSRLPHLPGSALIARSRLHRSLISRSLLRSYRARNTLPARLAVAGSECRAHYGARPSDPGGKAG